ncbi:flagellar basal body P-ring formation chaperone FlgA [Deltaproteobacteria bacterium OttesenSCG-928-M10]|nr:flagellar basal body P-ring formation chaperone FlgA [Deltaproteobacteria bacterium OttesenSCG-928-M10]
MTAIRPVLSLAIFLACLWPAALSAAVVSVAMPPENTVSGPRVLLGDVAFIDVLDPAGQDLAASLARVDLGAAPAAGAEGFIRRAQIEQRLKASRLNLEEVAWSLPEELRLTGLGQALNEESLKAVLEKYLAETEPYRSGNFTLLTVNFGNLPTLPPGQVDYRFVPQSSSNPAYLSGSFFFSVDGREVARSRINAQVDLNVEALVAVRALPKGHVIDENDVSLSLVPFNQAKGALTDPGPAVGSTVKSNLAAGDPIRDRNLTKSLMVRRGEMVTIIAQTGGLKVTASGQARQDGALGDTINVTNLDSKKNISARIIGPNTVEVIF